MLHLNFQSHGRDQECSSEWLENSDPGGTLTFLSYNHFLRARAFFLTLSQTTNFRHFQIERVRRRQFQFDENGRKYSKWVENTVGKG